MTKWSFGMQVAMTESSYEALLPHMGFAKEKQHGVHEVLQTQDILLREKCPFLNETIYQLSYIMAYI